MMKQKIKQCVTVCVGLLWAGNGLAQLDVPSDRIVPPVAGQIGTSEVVERDGFGPAPRVGVLAYCTDMAPNAAALGLMAYHGGNDGRVAGEWRRQGQFGAQNLVDMLMYDDSIPRFKDVVLIDGDREQPTVEELEENFDCVIAFTDKQCGIPIPTGIANQAATTLARFAQTGRGVVLTGFAFSSSIGFGDAIFRPGMSPLRKGGPEIDLRCSRAGLVDPVTGEPVEGTPCAIGSCAGLESPIGADPCTPQEPCPGCAKQCLDTEGQFCGRPNYQVGGQPYPDTPDFACDHMLSLVDGPTVSSWATALTSADVDPSATLCFDYDIGGEPLPFLAINEDRNIVAVNTFPPDADDINKFWYQCLIGNALQYACGNRTKCRERGCPNPSAPPIP